jgi:hypothetical protein
MPPDNTRPPRYVFEPPPLGARVLMTAVEVLGRAHDLERPRVVYKKTDGGEHCIALVFAGWQRPRG